MIAALPLLVLLMGLAVSDLMTRLNDGRGYSTPVLVAGGWLVGMIAVSLGDTYRPNWTRHRNHVLAFEDVGRQSDACGVALVGIGWWQTPGYSGLGRDIPIYQLTGDVVADRIYSSANYVLQATKAEPPPPPYERWRDFRRPVQHLCKRPGGCIPDPSAQVRLPPGVPNVE